jgi:predicted nucleotidyltransferase
METPRANPPHESQAGHEFQLEFPALRDPCYPVSAVADRLEPYLRVLVKRLHPEKIILFGSYAYGQPTEHSDFDLLVIRRGIATEKSSNLEIREAFDSVPGVPPAFTLLSKTPERIANRLAVRSPFYQDILGKGVLLYAQEALGRD